MTEGLWYFIVVLNDSHSKSSKWHRERDSATTHAIAAPSSCCYQHSRHGGTLACAMAYKVTGGWMEQVDLDSATEERKVIVRLDVEVPPWRLPGQVVGADTWCHGDVVHKRGKDSS